MNYGMKILWRFARDVPCAFQLGFVGIQDGRLIMICPYIYAPRGVWVDPTEIQWDEAR